MYFLLKSRPAGPEDPESAMFTYKADRLPDGFLRQWISGQRFDPPPPIPVKITIEPGESGHLDDYYDSKIYLMTKRLASFFADAGVDNLDIYAAEILEVESGKIFTDFVAFNVIGLVSAADMKKSRFTNIDGLHMFDSISVDENLTQGLLFFRDEASSKIFVHHTIKERAERLGIVSLMFLDPETLST
jgi:hypothetical protein